MYMGHVTDRKQLNRELLRQDFAGDGWQAAELERYKGVAANYARLEQAIAVLSDLQADVSYAYYGGFAATLGLRAGEGEGRIASIWEEDIFRHIHPDDLEEKYLQEMRFFRFVQRQPVAKRPAFHLASKLRMKDASGSYLTALHRMYYVFEPSGGSVWLSLCLYSPLVGDIPYRGMAVDSLTGQVTELSCRDDSRLLTEREKEILRLIDRGLTSKCMAETLSISIHTVSRHRQEILAKLQVKNSPEACRVARELGLI